MAAAAGMTAQTVIAWVAGLAVISVILWDVFETIILPRRVTRMLRLVRLFYRWTWIPWSVVARTVRTRNRRESFLSYFGPLSLLLLFAVWAVALIFGFAILHFAAGSAISLAPNQHRGFWADLYISGTTFFTLGLGDVTPQTELARVITVMEAGLGFGFLAVVISYLPVLYGAFSRREVNISLLDARAGSPPTAAELLRRHTQPQSVEALQKYLHDWETWAAELMESHLSYPVLCYFRSQHSNQSWLAALTTMLDVSALLIAYGEGALRWQAKLTFAISRHAVADLAQVLNCPPKSTNGERLPPAELRNLRALLVAAKLSPCCAEWEKRTSRGPLALPAESRGTSRDRSASPLASPGALPARARAEWPAGAGAPANLPVEDQRLADLRQMYEPYVAALADRLLMPVGGWVPESKIVDNWRTSAWARISTELESSPLTEPEEKEHF
ncbi:MAG: potassium channel family protein [Candidatus Acidiferrales bacterium]